MSKKFYWINFCLILLVLYLSVRNYEEWTNPPPRGKEATETKQKAAGPTAPAPVPNKTEMPPPAYYKVISEKNLFSNERKEFPPPLPPPEVPSKEAPKAAPKPPARPNVTLYGVAIVGEDLRTALVNNPNRKIEKGDREAMTVKVGDKVGEYSVSKIQEDRISLEGSGDSFDVLLFDPSRQKKRAAAPPTSTVPTPVPAPTPAGIPEKPGQPPPRIAPTPPRPFAPPAAPPAVGSPAPVRDLLRERLEQRRLQRGSPPAVQPQVQPQRTKIPAPPQKEEDDEDEE
jgi:hypothetical protein